MRRVTGEDLEELTGSLNGQLEAEIEPDEIYKRALVEGTLNKQTKEEIKQAVERAQKAYEIATTSLFRDCSSYSFDSYKKSLASPVSLGDLEDFTLKLLSRERRQVQRKDGTLEFLTPESLKKQGVKERYVNATFDRSRAIRHSELDFLAIGHEFVDSMLRYIGGYDFGGHTAVRYLTAPWIRQATSALQFNFTVRARVQRGDGTEYLFDLYTVVVGPDGEIDDRLSEVAAGAYSVEPRSTVSVTMRPTPATVESAFQTAKAHLESKVNLWDWDEDVDLLGIAQIVVMPSSVV